MISRLSAVLDICAVSMDSGLAEIMPLLGGWKSFLDHLKLICLLQWSML